MAATTVSRPEATRVFHQAIDTTIRKNGEVGMQVAVYHDGQLNQTTQHSYTQAASCEISVGVVDAACSTATAAVTSGV
jgi:hypothetical protein